MKKIIGIILLLGMLITLFAGCNYTIIDTAYSFTKAYVSLPNGEVIEGKVESWKDFVDGDQLQVKIDGKVYLTHSINVVLVKE